MTDEKDKELFKLLWPYKYWHEPKVCSKCGFLNTELFKYCFCNPPVENTPRGQKNPSFTSPEGIVMLIKEMESRKDGKLFFAKLIYMGDNVEAIDDDGWISRDYITDKTGKFRDACLEWMRENQ